MMQTDRIIFGDNTEELKKFPNNSVDAIITDSPYGLGKEPDAVKCLQDWIDHGYHEIKGRGFMGKHWGVFVPQPRLWKECYRVLKPGGHLLSFFGTRTYDWGTLAIRLAGFEIRDCIMWLYGSGFPKSLDVSKAIDKSSGAVRKIVTEGKAVKRMIPGANQDKTGSWIKDDGREFVPTVTEAATDSAKEWAGYGTALKPACEPICVARKPLEGTVIETVLKYGTGGINIDAGRIEFNADIPSGSGNRDSWWNMEGRMDKKKAEGNITSSLGRWPANIIHDGSDEVLIQFPDAKGQQSAITGNEPSTAFSGDVKFSGMKNRVSFPSPRNDSGSAARFFYCAKASSSERAGRKHPTIKPIALMEYLAKIYCRPGGLVLDPHGGSGTTAAACINTGMSYILIDNDRAAIAEANIFITDHILQSL